MPNTTSSPTSLPQSSDPIHQGLVLPPDGHCFHCGEVLPKRPFETQVLGRARQMCCLGCQLAAQSIVEAGLSQYYLDRQKISRLAQLPDELMLDVYNHDEIKEQFTYSEDGQQVAELSVAGLRCAACTWLIESRLNKIQGVGRCQVNLTQQRMRVTWDDAQTDIGTILKAVGAIGYEARPYRQDTHEAMLKRENRQMLIRLGVAAVGAMQAMMFSVGIYFGDVSGMAHEHREFLRWVSMVVSVPVVFYAGLPFFASAWSVLRIRQINMDVPVSIALMITFVASSYATVTQTGETYFDSVAMFIFFLLAGRYVEHSARLKASGMAADLVVITPKVVQKVGEDAALLQALQTKEGDLSKEDGLSKETLALIERWQSVFYAATPKTQENLVHGVKAGDVVRVDAGSEIIGDGILLSQTAMVSQSLLTGESDLIAKRCGDVLFGGSQNDAQPLLMIITNDNEHSQIALIDRLINRAMSEKPKIAQDADRIARWFVARVLVLAVVVFLVWWWIDPSQAIWATVAVLVATCPCALSLATPIALTVATNRLAVKEFLVTRGHTIATLAQITHIAFDKTGTLTTGQANLVALEVYGEDVNPSFDEERCLAYAAALEIGSRHPIAESLKRHSSHLHLPTASHVVHHAGGGVEAQIDGRIFRVGHGQFALEETSITAPQKDEYGANMAVALSIKEASRFRLLAWFYFNDSLRMDTKEVIAQLKESHLNPIMLTGDPSDNAKVLAKTLGMSAYTGLLPEQKVAHIKQLQHDGAKVLMVGDGINDAPVLAAADVSVAMAKASDLAQVFADGVLLGETLTPILKALAIAKKTRQIIRQNLRWALIYNTAMLLPAALGYVPRWLAAIGMSLSSLFVVMNALRLKNA